MRQWIVISAALAASTLFHSGDEGAGIEAYGTALSTNCSLSCLESAGDYRKEVTGFLPITRDDGDDGDLGDCEHNQNAGPAVSGFLICALSAVPQLSAVLQSSHGAAPVSTLEGFARRALQDASATGFIHVRDVDSGQVVHLAANGQRDLASSSPIAPLSIIKLYLAAEWLEQGLGSTVIDCGPGSMRHPMLVDEVLISGCDSAGKRMAVILRQKVGSRRMLRDLRRYGLDGISLRSDAGNTEWGQVLSLGEDQVPVTPQQLSAFMRAIGQGGAGLFSARTASRLRTALEGVVQRGTADGIKSALAGTGWRMGGKTGTGPGQCGAHCDGWFASLLSDQDRPRYVILVFIRGRGLGGGLAAQTAASVAEFLVEQRPSTNDPAHHQQ